jgi:hypothetical protein
MERDTLRRYLTGLGLRAEFADIYIALHGHSPQTLSELARTSGISRVNVYRLLDELKASGLVEVETHYKRTLLRAAPFSNIRLLRSYDPLEQSFIAPFLQSGATRVQFYEGIEGLRQMAWNQTKGKGENLSILYDSAQHKHTRNFAFFERWVHRCNERGIHFRGIVGDHFIAAQQEWYKAHTNERLEHWESRYISEQAFAIPYSTVIYDDVVLYYNWNDEQITGIEIHNAAIAQMQRQLFELLWQQAMPVNDLAGPSGS